MANISLTLGKHPKTEPIDSVVISWSGWINVQRLKNFVKGDGILNADEQAIWETYKDKKEWLYCFAGKFDTIRTINECYAVDENTRTALKQYCISQESRDLTRAYAGRDVKLDIGKVVEQTIEDRIKQHFNNEDYLEHYRRDGIICFPEYIVINRGEYVGNFYGEHKEDFIDALETVLIMGNVEPNFHRLGVCNDMKKVNPQLFYPIKEISNVTNLGAMEKAILVNIITNETHSTI